MATLELSIDEQVALSPVKRSRPLGPLFWAAAAWTIFIVAAAALAGFLPLPSPSEMDMLERRIVASKGVDPRDVVDDVAGPIPVPDLVLIHLGIEIVFSSAGRAARSLSNSQPPRLGPMDGPPKQSTSEKPTVGR